MVVVVIVGILAAVAIPAYNDYVTRSRRSEAFTALETAVADYVGGYLAQSDPYL